MTITVHPARLQRGRFWALTAFLTLCSALGTAWMAPTLHAPGGVVMAAIFGGMVLSLGRWYFPTRYDLDNDGLRVHYLGTTRSYRWQRFRALRRERGGLYLSPFSDTARFDHFRGLFVPLDKSVPPAVYDAMATFVEERLRVAGQSDPS